MLKFLEQENTSCAFYDLDDSDAIAALANRTILVEDGNVDKIPYSHIVPINGSGLMHHKFCVSNESVLTGSLNPTETGFFENDNNMLIIQNKNLAMFYQKTYEGLAQRIRPEDVHIQSANITIDALICRHSCNRRIVQELHAAEHTIRFMVFTFTERSVAHALLDAAWRNVSVQGVLEKRSASHPIYDLLHYQGIDVAWDGNPAILHHKVFVIDNKTVVTGSFNPTKSADERNDENMLVIHSERVAAWYLGEYERVKALSS
jgi:phosphatidylserine/phosphatidylglycerophosphate/cardiolipin synthase-like enzyme